MNRAFRVQLFPLLAFRLAILARGPRMSFGTASLPRALGGAGRWAAQDL